MPQPLEGKHTSRRVIAAFAADDWAIDERKLWQMVELLELRSQGLGFTHDEVQARIGGNVSNDFDAWQLVDGVAVIPIHGTLAPRMSTMTRISGGTSMQQVATWIREAAAHKDVRSLVLDIDSPGGTVAGTAELANVVKSVRGVKPIKAVATNMMGSAAYWIGSAADEVIASPSAVLGSIGVYGIHWDESKANEDAGLKATVIRRGVNKGLGTGVEPLSEAGRKVLQEGVDDHYAMFVEAVAANRGVSVKDVEEKFGQGTTFVAHRAVSVRMADREGTLEEVVRELAAPGGSRTTGPSAQATGVSHTPPGSAATTKEERVNTELKAALVKKGLIAAEASDATAQLALLSFCTALGVDPKDEAAALAALTAEKPATAPVKTVPPANVPESAVQAKADAESRKRERVRIEELTARAELLGVSAEQLKVAIESDWDIPQALDQWTKQLAADRRPLVRMETGEASVDKFAKGAIEALAERMGVALEGQASGYGEHLRFASMVDLARESLRLSGARVQGMDPQQIAEAALRGSRAPIDMIPRVQVDPNGRRRIRYDIAPSAAAGDGGYNKPSDFPLLMSNLMGRMLLPALEETETTYRNWCHRLPSVPDYRPKTLMEIGAFGELPYHEDGKGYEGVASPTMEANFIQVDEYGREWSMTPRMMIDDDLDGLSRVVTEHVLAHERTLNRLCINLLTANSGAGVTMPDGTVLFHSTHGNLVASGQGGVPSQSELEAIRLLLRTQTGVGGVTALNQRLWAILIPASLETVTEQAIADLKIMPVTAATTETFRGNTKWFVDTMLDAASTSKWYAFANPNIAMSIVYCHQTGFDSLRVRVYFDDRTNCRIHQFTGKFAAVARSHRGICHNFGS